MAPLLPPDPPPRPPTRTENLLVGATAVAAAAGAALASGEAAGWGPADVVWRCGFAVLAVLAGAKARRWTWLAATAVGAAAAPDLAVAAPALVGLAIALANAARGRRTRVVGAIALGLAVQSLLRLDLADPHGLSSLVAVAGTAPAFASGYRRSRTRTRRIVVATTAVLVVAGIGLAVAQAIAVLDARSSVATGIDAARAGFDAARSGDEPTAVQEFRAAAEAFREADDALSSPWARAGRAVPLLGQHARAMAEVTASGVDLAETAAGAADEAPIEELRFTDGVLDLQQVAEFEDPLARAEAALVDADEVVDEVDSGWLVPPLAERVDEFADEVHEALPQAQLAQEGVALAPDLFGGNGLRRYFLAFVTPAEQRGLGGFMGNFGVLTADRGDVRLARSDEVATLRLPPDYEIPAPPDFVARYGGGTPPGDVTLSPDLPSAAAVLEDMFTAAGGQPLDGVIMVDPYALQALLTFTGPITVTDYPTPLTSENAAQILLREQYVTFDQREGRKDFLEEASRRTFEALTSGDLPGPRRLTEVLGPMVDEGRLLVHSFREEERDFFTQVGLDGTFPAAEGGDLLAVTTQNSGHNKIDTFLTRQVRYEATVDPDTGTVDATATVTLVNEAPPGGLPAELIGVNPSPGTPNLPDLPDGTNFMYLSLYTPHTLAGADVDGEPLAVSADRELGLNVYAQNVTVPPGATVTVTFRLAGEVDLEDGYELVVAGQPTANPDEVSVAVQAAEGWTLEGSATEASWSGAEDRRLRAEVREG